jgi:phosphate starvation-inducible protein PhoH
LASRTTKRYFLDKHRKSCPSHLVKFKGDLFNPAKRIVIAEGLPSTGKTKCSIESGIEQVVNGTFEKLVIVRPVIIPACGLLPGLMSEKMAPYTRQSSIYVEMTGLDSFEELMAKRKVEVIPADLLQGNRFMDCFVLVDEAQHIHKESAFAILTRMGENTKMVLLGDTSKGQCAKKVGKESILNYAAEKLKDKDYVGVHNFYERSCVLGDEVTKDLVLTLMDDFM